MRNFQEFLSLKKKLECVQQELYHCLLAKPSTYCSSCITVVRKGLLQVFPFFKSETRISPDLLLPCVLASGVPAKEIKIIKVTSKKITTSDWVALDILTTGGTVIQEVQSSGCDGAEYSPLIYKMMKQGKLLEFR